MAHKELTPYRYPNVSRFGSLSEADFNSLGVRPSRSFIDACNADNPFRPAPASSAPRSMPAISRESREAQELANRLRRQNTADIAEFFQESVLDSPPTSFSTNYVVTPARDARKRSASPSDSSDSDSYESSESEDEAQKEWIRNGCPSPRHSGPLYTTLPNGEIRFPTYVFPSVDEIQQEFEMIPGWAPESRYDSLHHSSASSGRQMGSPSVSRQGAADHAQYCRPEISTSTLIRPNDQFELLTSARKIVKVQLSDTLPQNYIEHLPPSKQLARFPTLPPRLLAAVENPARSAVCECGLHFMDLDYENVSQHIHQIHFNHEFKHNLPWKHISMKCSRCGDGRRDRQYLVQAGMYEDHIQKHHTVHKMFFCRFCGRTHSTKSGVFSHQLRCETLALFLGPEPEVKKGRGRPRRTTVQEKQPEKEKKTPQRKSPKKARRS